MADRALAAEDVSLGRLVRVVIPSESGTQQKEEQRVGMVTLLHGEPGAADLTVDVEFDDPRKIALASPAADSVNMERLELEKVPVSRLRKLETWEETAMESAEELAEHDKLVRRAQFLAGRLRDFRSARAHLLRVLQQLAKPLSAGSIAVVYAASFDDRGVLAPTRIGMVATIEEGSVEIMGGDGCDDAEDFTVDSQQVISVPSVAAEADRYAELALVAARYALQQRTEAAAEAVCLCAVAIRILSSLEADDGNFEGGIEARDAVPGRLVEALVLKSRAHIVQGKLTAAAVDIKLAIQRNPSHKPARQLVTIIKQRRVVAQKQDRALAKSISTWVRDAVLEKDEDAHSRDGDHEAAAAASHDAVQNDQDDAAEGGWVSWARSSLF